MSRSRRQRFREPENLLPLTSVASLMANELPCGANMTREAVV